MTRAHLISTIVALICLMGCGSGSGCNRYEDCDYDFAEDRAEATGEPSDVDAADVEEPEFDSCTDDCSGHEAGFAWAQENDVTDASECGGNSDSFAEGCEAFASAREEQAQEQAEEAAEYESSESDDYDSGE